MTTLAPASASASAQASADALPAAGDQRHPPVQLEFFEIHGDHLRYLNVLPITASASDALPLRRSGGCAAGSGIEPDLVAGRAGRVRPTVARP